MEKGDILLIRFPFTDLSGSKFRPAVVLFSSETDIVVCFITTQLGWKEDTDIILTPTFENGLKKVSLLRTSKIACLDKTLAKGILGKLSTSETLTLNRNLKNLLGLE
jgi:mRNA interferase MazF